MLTHLPEVEVEAKAAQLVLALVSQAVLAGAVVITIAPEALATRRQQVRHKEVMAVRRLGLLPVVAGVAVEAQAGLVVLALQAPAATAAQEPPHQLLAQASHGLEVAGEGEALLAELRDQEVAAPVEMKMLTPLLEL